MLPFVNVQYQFYNMDKEQIVILAGVTLCALSIGAFIFWGPNPRSKRRAGAIVGLQNLGLTCFLNTLLQALASCALFLEWLETCRDQGRVASTLHYLLRVLSSERSRLPESVVDPLDPAALIMALQEHGWSIGMGEQDAHELFHLLMVTLEEEAHKAIPVDRGLSDSLESQPEEQAPTESQAEEQAPTESQPEEQAPTESQAEEQAPTESQPEEQAPTESTGNVAENSSQSDHIDSDHVLDQSSGDSALQNPSCHSELKLLRYKEVITRKTVPRYDSNRNYQASPFCGLLTSQLQCVKCGFKSVLRYDKFDSLSLHLPQEHRLRYTLAELLDNFTHTEEVTGVACDGCNKDRDPELPPITATSLKSLSIGKLPRALCFHIHRLSMGSNGTPYKRSDYIDFPEYFDMFRYTQNSIMKEQKMREENKEVVEDTKITSGDPCYEPGFWDHLYRLKAVVVHCGSVEGGHFVTYRRGPIGSNIRHRWFFTSDETVKESTLREAFQSAAYMLYYEKCDDPGPDW